MLIGCGSMVGLLLFVVCGLLAWLVSAGTPADRLARLKALPVYPGASSVKIEEKQAALPAPGSDVVTMLSGVLTFETQASAEEVVQFYDGELKKAGWQPAGRQSDGGGGLYGKLDGSFEGIAFTGAQGNFPWFRIKRSQVPLWVSVSATTLYRDNNKWSDVSIELTQP
jgi:hypothetical protein